MHQNIGGNIKLSILLEMHVELVPDVDPYFSTPILVSESTPQVIVFLSDFADATDPDSQSHFSLFKDNE